MEPTFDKFKQPLEPQAQPVEQQPLVIEETPILPTAPAPTSSPKKRFPRALIVLALLLAVGVGAYVVMSNRFTSPQEGTPASSALPTETPARTINPIDNSAGLAAYTRDPDPNAMDDYEVWLIDPLTKAEQKLDLKVASAYKHYGSSLLFYKSNSQDAAFHILDLATGTETVHTVIFHPQPDAIEMARIQNSNEISPDGKYFVFFVDYFEPCPSPSPMPTGFQGGFGPCTPEESEETPIGYYLYRVAEKDLTYLGPLVRVSRWDKEKGLLYYASYEPTRETKTIELASKNIQVYDTTPHFGYYAYPLISRNLLIKNEAATGQEGGGQTAFATMALYNKQENKSEVFDEVKEWSTIQPFITGSPDDHYVLYQRDVIVNGLHRSAIYKYDTNTKTQSRLTAEDNSISYSLYGFWLDNKTFVTSVDPIEEQNFTNMNRYLVSIDVETGGVTRLTEHNQVTNFNAY